MIRMSAISTTPRRKDSSRRPTKSFLSGLVAGGEACRAIFVHRA
jgi:hypothetical protein